jgi:predicted ATPase
MMKKIVITGGPHTGKTTLLEGLRQSLPGVYFIDEPAELVIKEERKKAADSSDYEGIYPWSRYPEFAKLVMSRSVALEHAIPLNAEVVLLDRSLADNVGFARVNGCEYLVPEMMRLARIANYSAALLCDFVGEYAQTEVRFEDEERARLTHSHLLDAYEQLGIEVVNILALPIEDRLTLAREVISEVVVPNTLPGV